MQDVDRGVASTFEAEMKRFEIVSAADNVSRESTSASPITSRIILDPLNPLESAPVPKVIVKTVPLNLIMTKAVDPTVGRPTQKQAKKSVHWGRVHFKITELDARVHFKVTDFEALLVDISNP